MNKILICLWMGLLMAGCNNEKAAVVNAQPAGQMSAGGLRFDIEGDYTGDNELGMAVRVFDSEGKPLDAHVSGEVIMPAMGAMAEMRDSLSFAKRDGAYETAHTFSMAGKWNVVVQIHAGEHSVTAYYSTNTLTRQFTFERSEPPAAGKTASSADNTRAAEKSVALSPERRQLIGVTFGEALVRPLQRKIRAFGRVEVNEQSLSTITVRAGGWVRQVYVNSAGARVKKGQPLMKIYSPELNAAQQELVIARKSGMGGALVAAAEAKLRALNVPESQIQAIGEGARPSSEITIRSPQDGYVVAKDVVAGQRIEEGMAAFQIGNLGKIWIVADVFEADAPFVAQGQKATVRMLAGGREFEGRVAYVYPTVNSQNRTLPVRLEFRNVAEALKPGMGVDVYIESPSISMLSVPQTALLQSGEHAYVFLDGGEGKLTPREVKPGMRAGEYVAVLSGLAAGDRVSTSANFLLSSEAQLQDALPKWGAP